METVKNKIIGLLDKLKPSGLGESLVFFCNFICDILKNLPLAFI